MNHSLFDIILFIAIAGSLSALVWELIPDGMKKYWNYGREVRRDRKRERRDRRRYSFSWRIDRN